VFWRVTETLAGKYKPLVLLHICSFLCWQFTS